MRIIYPQNAILYSASSELSSAPAVNVTEEHANNPWYADTSDSSPSITVEVTEGSNDLSIGILVYKIFAESVTITAKTMADATIKTETHNLVGTTEYGIERHKSHIWMEYSSAASHKVTVDLTKGSSFAYAGIGIIFVGPVLGPFTDPRYGNLSMDAEDHSEIIELSGGVEHVLLDNIQRICPASLEVYTTAEFNALIRIGRFLGKSRMFACKMAENYDYEEEMLIYARADPPITGQPVKYRNNKITYTLREFL